MRVSFKYNMIILGIIVAAIVTSSFFIYLNSEQKMSLAVLNEQATNAQITGSLVDNKIAAIKEVLILQTNVQVVKEATGSENPKQINYLQNYLESIDTKSSDLGMIFVYNDQGHIIASTNHSIIGVNVLNRSYAKAAIAGRPSKISPMFIDFSDTPVIILSESIVYQGKIVGAIAIAVDLDKLSAQIFSESNAFFTGQMFVVDSNGLVIVSRVPEEILNLSLTEFPWFEQVILNNFSSYEIDVDGKMYLIGVSSIPNTPWYNVFVLDYDNLFAGIHATFNKVMIINIIAFILAIFIIFLIMRKRLAKAKDIEAIDKALQATTQNTYFILSKSYEVIYVADECINFFKLDSAEEFKTNWQKLFPKYQSDGRETLDVLINVLHLIQDKVISIELNVLDSKGVIIPCSVSIVPIIYSGQTAFLILYRDLMEQKKTEYILARAREVAENAAKSKSDFLANMSHEIRTPMNGIIGLTYLALQSNDLHRQINYLKQIDVSAKSLLRIINDILDFSKIDAGKLELEDIPFQLEILLDNLTVALASYTTKPNVDLLINLDNEVPLDLMGDPLRLTQILTNLASNALKFTEKGEVEIGIVLKEKIDNSVFIDFYVKDTGIGIAKEKLQSIFQSFSQADSSTTREYGGTGLGLAICRNLVEMMGGQLQVQSKLGQGTCFSFSLKFEVAKTIARRNHNNMLPNLKVLAVDDNELSRKIIKNYLEKMVKHIDIAESGKEALEYVSAAIKNQEPYDILLLDWKMPEMDGLDLAKRIRELEDGKEHSSVLMVTAYNRDELLPHMQELDIKEILVKPLTPSRLWDSINSVYFAQEDIETTLNNLENVKFADYTILLAEDNEINQLIATELLENVGLKVEVAENGKIAVDLANSKHFDLILMDIQMPEMDGLAATKEIRKNPKLDSIPIIAMTAHALQGDKDKSIESGMQDHLTKPINPAELYELLSLYLKRVS